MASTLPAFGDCCLPCESPVTVSVPGPAGANGTNGTDGTDGTNSYTLTTAQFTMPVIDASVAVEVADSGGFYAGQYLPVQFAGIMTVAGVPDTTHLTLTNSSIFADNVVAGTVIPVSAIVGPATSLSSSGLLFNATTGTYYRLTISGAVGAETFSWGPA